MKTLLLSIIIVVTTACAGAPPSEGTYDPNQIVAEIELALRAEIRSFESKDCAAAVQYFADQEPLFVVSGNARPSRADLEAGCPQMVARIPEGARRPVASEYIYATGLESGYSVTEFRIPFGPGGQQASQYVTKVWSKLNGEWRIVHVHESVAPLQE